MSEARVQEMIERACFGKTSEAEFRADLGGFLARHGLSREDAEAIAASPSRLALYRRLIRNNVTGVTERMLARTRARMNEIDGAFDATLDTWLDEAGPRTHHLRDVPHEMFAWAQPRWRARADVPAWLVELAQHELAEYAIAAGEGSRDLPPVVDVALDRALVLARPIRLDRYAFAVHELPADVDDRSVPREAPTALLAYRDAEHAARFLELTPLAASIVERVLAGETLGAAVTGACADLGSAPNDAVLATVAQLLSDFGARGVLLGARP